MFDSENPSPTRLAVFANPQVVAEGWYVAARSSEVRPGRIERRAFHDFELAIYRDSRGRAHVLNSRCAHFGASLADGRIEDDCLVCPFHAFKYNSKGECVGMPSDPEKADRFRIRSFPVEERWGQVWFWLGSAPSYSLDVFAGLDQREYLWFPRRPFTQHRHVMISNIFDVTHFKSVHFLEVDHYSCRTEGAGTFVEMHFTVTPRATWLFRLFGFRKLRIHVTTFGDNNYQVEFVAPIRFSFLTSYAPQPGGGTLTASVAAFPRFPAWKRWTGLWRLEAIAKMLCVSTFFADDEKWINHVRFKPRFISSDKYIVEFIRKCNGLKIFEEQS